jgi:hypothetical protein
MTSGIFLAYTLLAGLVLLILIAMFDDDGGGPRFP